MARSCPRVCCCLRKGAPQRGELPRGIAKTTLARPPPSQGECPRDSRPLQQHSSRHLLQQNSSEAEHSHAPAPVLRLQPCPPPAPSPCRASNLRGCTSSSTFLASLAASSWWLLCKAVAVSARTTYLLAKSPLQLAAFVARAYCSALAYCMRKSWAACKVLVAGTARVCLVTPLKLMVSSGVPECLLCILLWALKHTAASASELQCSCLLRRGHQEPA